MSVTKAATKIKSTREERAKELLSNPAYAFVRYAEGCYTVQNLKSGIAYEVDMGACSCPDPVSPCKHILACEALDAREREAWPLAGRGKPTTFNNVSVA